jgi:hypothetical protein
MRGTVAKRLRTKAYGKDMAVVKQVKTVAVKNKFGHLRPRLVCDPVRQLYQRLKRKHVHG